MATHELVFGSHGTLRRQLSAFVLAVIVATAARELAFADWVFGSHLRTNLGPLERPDAGYTLLLAARAWDTLMQLAALWPNAASNDGCECSTRRSSRDVLLSVDCGQLRTACCTPWSRASRCRRSSTSTFASGALVVQPSSA